jgi:hypothetical protein
MKIIIAGSRTIIDKIKVNPFIDDGLKYLVPYGSECEIVSGRARGVDNIGEEYAKRLMLPLKIFPADWGKYGKRAGYLRNKQMAEYADALILIWDGKSRGSKMMLELAKQHKLRIYEQVI